MTKDITPKPHETDIRTIIDRYMSGETTNEEEATLRTWFRLAGDDMPEEWRPLKALFSFVDEERETAEADAAETVVPADASLHSRNTLLIALRRPRIWISSAVAAVAVAIVMRRRRTKLSPRNRKTMQSSTERYTPVRRL